MNIPLQAKTFLRLALEEDLGFGDITTEFTVPETSRSRAVILAKGRFVLAGMPFVKELFALLDNSTEVKSCFKDGSVVKKGEVIAKLSGGTRTLLSGERVALNILQRLSGIATMTQSFVKRVKDLNVKIVDTRKTVPGMRFMEKYAVRVGGGKNHRFGLHDGILIKDNHIKAAGGITAATRAVTQAQHLSRVEVEVGTLEELREALSAGVEVIMLDNMSLKDMKKAVALVNKRALLEASGNVTVDTVRQIAETGVDLISVGAITHSAPAADISLKITA